MAFILPKLWRNVFLTPVKNPDVALGYIFVVSSSFSISQQTSDLTLASVYQRSPVWWLHQQQLLLRTIRHERMPLQTTHSQHRAVIRVRVILGSDCSQQLLIAGKRRKAWVVKLTSEISIELIRLELPSATLNVWMLSSYRHNKAHRFYRDNLKRARPTHWRVNSSWSSIVHSTALLVNTVYSKLVKFGAVGNDRLILTDVKSQ